ncbi:acyltransferase family protein [Jejuia spongiicola]|uniref:Acyltransferase n=1 Tax=Jejuia spongiicola TaxID=2942207 RepID=A0ABT0QJR5_9FLAO|nr:acyltransferase [Jejuia spongiicola]MCL6296723.1 acyltransferase [Jejuia spongiicola]
MTNNTPTKIHFYGLDHLRVLAITLVLIFHYTYFFTHPDWWPAIAKFGWTGVDLFFVLSGFLISSHLFQEIKNRSSFSYKHFFIKRAFRILPVYFVVVAIYFLFPILRERPTLPELWRFLTFTHNIGLDASVHNAFSHAWSLCVEEHFYILLPLILLLLIHKRLLKHAYILIIGLFIAGFFLRYYLWHNQYLPNFNPDAIVPSWTKPIYFPTYNRLDGLLVGVSIAATYVYLPAFWNKITNFGNLLLVIGLGILTLCYFLCSGLADYSTSIWGFPLIAIGYGFLVTGAVSSGSILFRWKSKASTFIALLSYSIYLIHKIATHVSQTLFSNFGVDPKSGLMAIICFATCVIFAWVLYTIIEIPFMKMRNRLIYKKDN